MDDKTEQSNLAFIDGQNLYSGTMGEGWKISYKKFRIYLKEKYNVANAYYFLGYELEKELGLYRKLRESGFELVFKEHSKDLQSNKKGNVDTDIVFQIMKDLIENVNLDKVLLVSGDGDYKKVVRYLIKNNKFQKILFPNNKASSLYKDLGSEYFDYVSSVRNYIEHFSNINEKSS